MKKSNKKIIFVTIFIIIGLLLILGITFGATFYFFNQKLVSISNKMNTLTSELQNTQIQLQSTQSQVKLLEDNAKRNDEFFRKYSEAISLINKAYTTFQLAEINFQYARSYDTLTTNLYTSYNIQAYSYDAHISYLDTSITQYSDAILTIKKANKLLLELKETTNDSFWSKEIGLRLEQAKLFEDLFFKNKQLVESNKMMQYYYYIAKDQNLYQSELNNFNNKLLPESNELREKVLNKLTEINLFWDEDIYSTE